MSRAASRPNAVRAAHRGTGVPPRSQGPPVAGEEFTKPCVGEDALDEVFAEDGVAEPAVLFGGKVRERIGHEGGEYAAASEVDRLLVGAFAGPAGRVARQARASNPRSIRDVSHAAIRSGIYADEARN